MSIAQFNYLKSKFCYLLHDIHFTVGINNYNTVTGYKLIFVQSRLIIFTIISCLNINILLIVLLYTNMCSIQIK